MSASPMFGVVTVKRTRRRMPGVTPPSSTLQAAGERFSSRTSHCEPRMSERTMRLAPCACCAPLLVELSATATRTAAHSTAADKRILNLKGMYLLSVCVVEGSEPARRPGGRSPPFVRFESQENYRLLI